ncbi:polysaccharide pyruvyl transferase family protein [Vibrio renipiscarius]|uniref:polysaccharide pyruvyl transferase family protein n=1 Tax=Vibrio renipiscarius TaxID=1461322 RepID=UPI00126A128B|nr:polysaccharide pyruvyl transferase family protein [Vibrio renipiscarius]
MNNVLIYSFYTDDQYYSRKKDELVANLDRLNIEYKVDLLKIPEGLEWSDVCRKKIEMFHQACVENPDKKVFWIDVDCQINYLPEYIANFSSDIIGFARGFSSPMRTGYHLRSRFWEPCFIGVNNTPNARRFISDALTKEKEFEGKATDDYFFEESWRMNCDSLSYQIIPSRERTTRENVGFFSFGASGNVENFVGKVAQHEKIDNSKSKKQALIKTLSKLGLLNYTLKVKRAISGGVQEAEVHAERLSVKSFKHKVLVSALNNKVEQISELKKKNIMAQDSVKNEILAQASSILEYQNYANESNPIPLCWWFDPAPGNFGDWLSPYIITRISKRSVKLITPNKMKSFDSKNIVSIGSIAKFANSSSIVLGSGVSRKETELNNAAEYLMLRGPITQKVLESSEGTMKNEVFGDPAIVMPRVFECERSFNGRVALVRHFSHLGVNITLSNNMDELSILASSSSDIESFISQLNKYDSVITSAMHCYIICQAYGIPAALVNWESHRDGVAGDGMKYIDYALGVGVQAFEPKIIAEDFNVIDVNALLNHERVSQEKINETYSYLVTVLNEMKNDF